MQLIENFGLYNDCKTALIESYGDIEIAKNKLKKSKHSNIDDLVLEQNLNAIKESLGDKLLNFFSKSLGGDISKLDKTLADMKEEEINFIQSEHESESTFYKMCAALARLKKDKADKSEQDIIRLKIAKLEKYIKTLLSSHNSIMDDFEKKINIIIKGNKRKTEYYNLKRAEDSVETKKMRAEYKKKLMDEEEDSEYLKDIQKILGTKDDAVKDLEKAKEEQAKRKDEVSAKEEGLNKFKADIKDLLDAKSKEIEESLKDIEEYYKKIEDLINDKKKLNSGAFSAMKVSLEKKIERAKDSIQDGITKIKIISATEKDDVNKKSDAIDFLVNIQDNMINIKYFSSLPTEEEIEKQKKYIDDILEEVKKANKVVE